MRIIPAYAGSTGRTCCIACSRRDHPRVCGEHVYKEIAGRVYRGSSPRMRGALEKLPAGPYVAGIIPAYAGSTYDIAEGEHKG